MNERDLSQKTPSRCTSPRRGTPDAIEGIYPADTSRKDPDWQTGHQDAAAAAISPNAQPHSTEAPLFVIDHTWVPPPTKAQLLQEQHLAKQKTVNYFLSVFFQYGTKTLLFLRGYQKIIAMKLIYLPLLRQLNSQRLFKKQSLSSTITTLKVMTTMCLLRTLQRPRLSPTVF
jgi:hypothetical protein